MGVGDAKERKTKPTVILVFQRINLVLGDSHRKARTDTPFKTKQQNGGTSVLPLKFEGRCFQAPLISKMANLFFVKKTGLLKSRH